MRVVREISSSDMKITIFSWNNRYLIKLEQGLLEQTYKVDQFDVTSEEELLRIIDTPFIQYALKLFEQMNINLHDAKNRLG